jgi:hypothetical protein
MKNIRKMVVMVEIKQELKRLWFMDKPTILNQWLDTVNNELNNLDSMDVRICMNIMHKLYQIEESINMAEFDECTYRTATEILQELRAVPVG